MRPVVCCISQGSASSKAFYTKARTNLWRQAATLCGVACGVVVVTLIKQLTTIGRDTPSVISTAQVIKTDGGGYSSRLPSDEPLPGHTLPRLPWHTKTAW